MIFKVARASEYLAITGWGISDIKLAKKAWVFLGRTCTKFDISPVNYTFEVQAMSKEKLPFILPAVFTIGPRSDDKSLMKYARVISPHDKFSNHVKELVRGVIEGETRAVAASMTMEEIFQGEKGFEEEVLKKVQSELDKLGLYIYNANIKQLVDIPGHEYFSYLEQKTQAEAESQAKVHVAEARKEGEVGVKKSEGETQQKTSKIDADTKVMVAEQAGNERIGEMKIKTNVQKFENEKEAEVVKANTKLMKKKAGWTRDAQVAEIEAAKAVALREAKLQKKVEKMNVMTQTEKLRAEFLSKAQVEYDIKEQEAKWELVKQQKAADAELYRKQKEAKAQIAFAMASFCDRIQAAEADSYAKQKEAQWTVIKHVIISVFIYFYFSFFNYLWFN